MDEIEEVTFLKELGIARKRIKEMHINDQLCSKKETLQYDSFINTYLPSNNQSTSIDN